MRVHIRALADLPPKKLLVAYVKEARRLNDEGIKEPKHSAPGARTVVLPSDFKKTLVANPRAQAIFTTFSPSQRREYVEWITSAKRATTRAERIATAVAWLAEGKRRNWKYEKRC
jgi:uncharacterized protein YdeI (YjbR/CyaY-like superfamily)